MACRCAAFSVTPATRPDARADGTPDAHEVEARSSRRGQGYTLSELAESWGDRWPSSWSRSRTTRRSAADPADDAHDGALAFVRTPAATIRENFLIEKPPREIPSTGRCCWAKGRSRSGQASSDITVRASWPELTRSRRRRVRLDRRSWPAGLTRARAARETAARSPPERARAASEGAKSRIKMKVIWGRPRRPAPSGDKRDSRRTERGFSPAGGYAGGFIDFDGIGP